ncbi:hypothetical protein SNE40_009184 [Patella caerulea]|uniref:ribonuclease III n=1 Tax=Patella caerulea TaxID=87958 RepID=A0AAN8PXW3_PATCE
MFSEDLKLFKEIEEVLIGKDKDDDIKDEDVSCYGDLLPPYNPTNNQFTGSKVTLSNSIGLVNRYCAKLPSDAFTHLTPQCNVMTRDTAEGVLYVGHLRLPINSPIKEEITGEPMPTKKLAQMAVAHKACEILHKRGELDEQLQPVGKEMFLQEQQEDWDDEDVSSQGRPGTTKRKQYYFKKIADAFMCSHPVENTACYLYMIHMRLTGPITDEQNTRGRSIYAPEETSRCLGIISSKFIPQVPMFPVYTRSGEVTVSIDLCRSDIVITHDQLDKLQKFHHFVFTQVLHLDKDPMECNPKIADVGYLIVPLDPDLSNVADIEWNFVDYVTGVNSYQKKNVFDSKRDIFEFRKEDFEDAVVMPSYRNIDQPQNFYVAEIRYDLSPLSSFPSPELYKTFDNYYTTKYGLVITNTDQPLLDVDHTSARLNLLTPRYMNQKGVALPTSSAETKRARRENLQQKQILIPELCDIHVFPASLWRKAACLPAILYRMNYLLLAEEIRIRISMETGIGVTDLPDEFRFPQLDFGFETSPDKIKRESADKPDVKDNDCQLSNENENDPNQTCVRVPKTENGSSMNSAGCDFTHSQTNSSLSSVSSSFCKCDIPSTSCDMSIDKCDNVSAKCGNASAKSDVESNNCEVASDKCDIVSDKCDVTSDKCDSSSDSDSGIVSSASDVSIKSEDKISSSETEFDADNKSNPQDFQQKSKSYCSKTQDEIRALNKLHNKMAAISIDNPVNDNISNIEQRTISDCNKHDMQIYQNQSSDLTNLVNNIPDESQSLANKVKPLCQSSSCITESIPTKTSHHSNTPDTNPPPQPSQEIPSSTDSFNSNIEKGVKPNPESFEHEPRISNHHSSAVFPVGVWNNPKPKPAEIPDEGKNYSLPEISLDTDRDLETFVGPSPCLILQALTMSNANDFFSLERLETIGDSFLKYAITVYLYCTYPGIHEGKLSYLRSKQVSNYNLYRLGQKHGIAECMVSAKFEPYENWLPPCYIINEDRRRGPVPKVLIAGTKNDKMATNFVLDESETSKKGFPIGIFSAETGNDNVSSAQVHNFIQELKEAEEIFEYEKSGESSQRLIPYSLQTQHGIPDKSVADCAEALIGCYLTTCGKKAALMFMSWLGLKVLPKKEKPETLLVKKEGQELSEDEYEDFSCPISPLIKTEENAADKLEALLDGYDELENSIQYKFRDRSYLLQAFTHASYHYNTVTDCYQRLEFLGDAILDYVITRHLYEDSQKHSPGILTDLRSALVNNNIFAALAVKWDFHKYFKAISPALFQVIEKFVSRQKEREDEIDLDDEFNDNEEEDEDGLEEVEMEIPKALGDIFESVAGAIYLDSGMSLDTVWNVYYGLMKPQIEKYLKCIPKSPVRELLEMEPETAKFEKPERTMDGKIRVTVNVVGKGVFSGIGRNYRIAKSAAAKKALRYMKTMQQQGLI